MDELIDILDAEGNYTGKTAMKSEAHKKGLFHPTVHVWCYSRLGKVLLQQRGVKKEIYPLKWDVSVAGHIGAGESPEVGAFREVKEEIGVTINIKELEKIDVIKREVIHENGIWDREFTQVFLYPIDEQAILTKQDEEVEALEWISLNQFRNWISSNDERLITTAKERHLGILETISSRL